MVVCVFEVDARSCQLWLRTTRHLSDPSFNLLTQFLSLIPTVPFIQLVNRFELFCSRDKLGRFFVDVPIFRKMHLASLTLGLTHRCQNPCMTHIGRISMKNCIEVPRHTCSPFR